MNEHGYRISVMQYIGGVESCNKLCNVMIAWLGYAAVSRNIRMCCIIFASLRSIFVIKNDILAW